MMQTAIEKRHRLDSARLLEMVVNTFTVQHTWKQSSQSTLVQTHIAPNSFVVCESPIARTSETAWRGVVDVTNYSYH